MDMIMVMNNIAGTPSPDVMTTWHDDDTVEEVSEIPATFGSIGNYRKVWAVIGSPESEYETACLAALLKAPTNWDES